MQMMYLHNVIFTDRRQRERRQRAEPHQPERRRVDRRRQSHTDGDALRDMMVIVLQRRRTDHRPALGPDAIPLQAVSGLLEGGRR